MGVREVIRPGAPERCAVCFRPGGGVSSGSRAPPNYFHAERGVHVEGSLLKDEEGNKVRQDTTEGSIRPVARLSFKASGTETVEPGSNLPTAAGAAGGARGTPPCHIRPPGAPQEALNLFAHFRPAGGITDSSLAVRGHTRGSSYGCRPAEVNLRHNNQDYAPACGTGLVAGSGAAAG